MVYETDLETYIIEGMNEMGVVNVKAPGYRIPDRIFFIPGGSPLLIEVKKDKDKTERRGVESSGQKRMAKYLKSIGYNCIVVESKRDADKILSTVRSLCLREGLL